MDSFVLKTSSRSVYENRLRPNPGSACFETRYERIVMRLHCAGSVCWWCGRGRETERASARCDCDVVAEISDDPHHFLLTSSLELYGSSAGGSNQPVFILHIGTGWCIRRSGRR